MKKLFIGLTLLSLIILAGCEKNDVYKLGFAGTLTGNFASVGLSEMYGTELAVEEINASGGINGKQIELVIKDDEASSDKAVEVDNELKEMGIDIIIGHSVSIVAEKAIENANDNDILLLSPSIGSEYFTGDDDNLIRNVSTTYTEGISISEKIVADQPDKVLLIYNLDNLILTQYHKSSFEEVMIENGYTSDDFDVLGYNSQNDDDISQIETSLSSGMYDTVYIVGPNNDAAPMVNYITGNDIDVDIHLSSWASIGLYQLIDTVNTDGIYLYYEFLEKMESARYVTFKTNYEEKYGLEVDMLCVNAYDLVYLLKTAAESSNSFDIIDIKKEITSGKQFDGIVGYFTIDEYGDCNRQNYQMIIEDGEVKFND